ncbi:MAG: hypothetical protein ACRD3L_08760 [Terriglobales bacterium]
MKNGRRKVTAVGVSGAIAIFLWISTLFQKQPPAFVLVILLVAMGGCFLYAGSDWFCKKAGTSAEVIGRFMATLFCSVVIPVCLGFYFWPTKPIVQLSLACRFVGLPLGVEAQETIYVLPLNEARDTREHSVLFTISNGGDQLTTWPKPEFIAQATKDHDLGALAGYKCEVFNQGTEQLGDVSIPFQLGFGGGKQSVSYTVNAGHLNGGHKFTFYVVNECPQQAHAAYSTPVVEWLNGERVENVNFEQKGNLMIFVPTRTPWMTGDPCK